MKCPNCGHRGKPGPFCPECGADLTSRSRSRRRRDRDAAAAVACIAVIAVAAVVVVALGGDGSEDGASVASTELETSGGVTITLSGAFEDGTLTAYLDSDGQLVITLDDGASEGYSTFRWVLTDDMRGESSSITKDEAKLTWIEPSVGYWTVAVTCSGGSDDAEYSGGIECLGDSTTTFGWTHAGTSLSLTYTVGDSEFDVAVLSLVWESDDLESAVATVDPDGVAAELESKVWAVYSAAFSGSRTSADYAGCILGMISSCFTLRSDLEAYGQDVYWAGPAKTVYFGVGDSGDLAVLAASMLKAAGFEVGIASLPDGYAVGLASGDVSDGVYLEADGTAYWLCYAYGYLGVGVLSDSYAMDGGALTYCGGDLPDGCGFSIC